MYKYVFFIVGALLCSHSSSFCEIPRVINYQGVLLGADEQPVPEGNYRLTFRIYDEPGNELWAEVHNQVWVEGGLFQIILGTVTPLGLPFDQPYFLGIQVNDDPELEPRMALTSAAYSFNADKVAGGNNIFPSDGNVGIGIAIPSEKLQVTGTIHSTQGGFKFPDGTVQTSAASGSAGGVSQINVGTGMTVTNPTGPTTTLGLNMGHGNGIDADKVDGKDAAAFAAATHNHDDRYYTEAELNNSDGDPPNSGSNRVSWNNLKDVPAGFTDGVDNEGGAGGNITAVIAGTGLAGGGASGDVTLNVKVPLELTGSLSGTTPVIKGINTGTGNGVYGSSTSNNGVYGISNSGVGVSGESANGAGIAGYSQNGYAGYFDGKGYFSGNLSIGIDSPNNLYELHVEKSTDLLGTAAIFGHATVSPPMTYTGYGVYGLRSSEGTGGAGVFGEAIGGGNGVYGKTDDTDGYGIYGENTNNGYAGYFDGKGHFSDNLSIGTETPDDLYKLHVVTSSKLEGAAAIFGNATKPSSPAVRDRYGVYGLLESYGGDIGAGVLGEAKTGSLGYGVWGKTDARNGAGVAASNSSNGNSAHLAGLSSAVSGYCQDENDFGGWFVGRGYFSNNLGIGTQNPEQKLHVNGLARFDVGSGQINISTPGGNPGIIAFAENGHRRDIVFTNNILRILNSSSSSAPTTGISISENGYVGINLETFIPNNILTIARYSATDPIADAWTTYSSRRWKTNIKPIGNALALVQRLRGVTFDWKENGEHDIGLIAEEVGEVVPEVVAYEDNGVDAKSVDYARLVAVLIEAVKEQQKEIEKLKATVKAVASD